MGSFQVEEQKEEEDCAAFLHYQLYEKQQRQSTFQVLWRWIGSADNNDKAQFKFSDAELAVLTITTKAQFKFSDAELAVLTITTKHNSSSLTLNWQCWQWRRSRLRPRARWLVGPMEESPSRLTAENYQAELGIPPSDRQTIMSEVWADRRFCLCFNGTIKSQKKKKSKRAMYDVPYNLPN